MSPEDILKRHSVPSCLSSSRCATNDNKLGDGIKYFCCSSNCPDGPITGCSDHLVAPGNLDSTIDFTLDEGESAIHKITFWPQGEYCTGSGRDSRDVKTVQVFNKPNGATDWVSVLVSGDLAEHCATDPGSLAGNSGNTPTDVAIPDSAGASAEWRVKILAIHHGGRRLEEGRRRLEGGYHGFTEVEFFGCPPALSGLHLSDPNAKIVFGPAGGAELCLLCVPFFR